MHVFIDDSGDPGFKLDKNSSSHFVIAMVIFDDPLEVEKVAIAIRQLRRELFGDDVEFKFNKSRHDIKKIFLKTVKLFSFRVRALVVNKRQVRSVDLQRDKKSFYAYFIKTALKYYGDEIRNARIRIDGGGDRIFRREFISYLRRALNVNPDTRVVRDVKFEDSRTNVLVQLADMVAGCIHREHAKGEAVYRRILADKIVDVWVVE